MPRSGLSEPRFNLLRSIRFIATVIFTLGAEFTVTFQSPTEHSVHCDTRVCSNRMGHLSAFQSPTEHSVHCDIPLTQHANAHPSFNLLRSIRFIATACLLSTVVRGLSVSISYGAFGSLRLLLPLSL